jgi:hypothetical protein
MEKTSFIDDFPQQEPPMGVSPPCHQPVPWVPGRLPAPPAAVTAAAATATPAVGRSVEELEEVAMEERPSGMVSRPLKALTDGVII